MNAGIWPRLMAWWAAILVLAIANGALREGILISWLGVFAGQVISGLILCALILLVALVAMPGFSRLSAQRYWTIGLVWLGMTLAFEFGFGLFVRHKQLSELLRAYTFEGGNIWPLVLASTLVSPRLAAHWRRLL